MLTPQELLQIVDTMHPLLDDLNEWITNDLIARLMARLGRGEELLLTGTDEWQVQVYQSAGGHLEALQRKVQQFTRASDAEVKAIFEDAGIRAWAADDEFYTAHGLPSVPLLQSESMVRLLTDTYQRTKAAIRSTPTKSCASASPKSAEARSITCTRTSTRSTLTCPTRLLQPFVSQSSASAK